MLSTPSQETAGQRVPFFHSLQGKLIVRFFLVAAVPLLALSGLVMRATSANLNQMVGANLVEIAFNTTDKLDRTLFERYGDVQAFAHSEAARSMDPARIAPWMDQMVRVYSPFYSLMLVAGLDGKVIAVSSVDSDGAVTASTPLLGADVSQEFWFKNSVSGFLKTGQTFVEDLHSDSLVEKVLGADRSHSLSFSAPIYSSQGEIVGVWSTRLNWAAAQAVMSEVLEREDPQGARQLRLLLVNQSGTVLSSDGSFTVLQDNLKDRPVVDSALSAGASGWEFSKDLLSGGGEQLVGFYHSDGYSNYPGLNWSVLAYQDRDIALQAASQLGIQILWISSLGLVLISVVAALAAGSISRAARQMAAAAARIAEGDLSQDVTFQSRDELGQLAGAFRKMSNHLRGIQDVASRLAEGDLTVQVQPASAKDQLSSSFQTMVTRLRQAVGQVRSGAGSASQASSQLAEVAQRATAASAQISSRMAQVSAGTAEQSQQASQTASSIDQLAGAIEGIANGAAEQATAVGQAVQVTHHLAQIHEQVLTYSQDVSKQASQAASAARSGAEVVSRSLTRMRAIQERVGASALKVKEMGTRSEQIGAIVEAIDQIARQTNLLALNAAIEAARASGKSSQIAQTLLQNHLLSAAHLLAELDQRTGGTLDSDTLTGLAHRTQIDTLLTSDSDGVINASNEPGLIGYRFSENPREQSFAFRALLNSRTGVVTQPIQPRSKDNVPFMWVGISRRGQAGIIQAGMSAEVVQRSSIAAQGFAVVADEVRRLADQAAREAKEIARLVSAIQQTAGEAGEAMGSGLREVDSGVRYAQDAGHALQNILQAVEQVQDQALETARATQNMQASSLQMVAAIESVSAVVEENSAATEEMAASSNEVNQAVSRIAAISQQNSAAVGAISQTAGELDRQLVEVDRSAQALAETVAHLDRMVSLFKTDDQPASTASPLKGEEAQHTGETQPARGMSPISVV